MRWRRPMQAIVDDCARQLALRKAAGESEEAVMNEAIGQAATGKPSAPQTTIVELRAFVAERFDPGKPAGRSGPFWKSTA